MSSHVSRVKTKGRRYLPSIPAEGDGVKRSVTFNQQTIETSIGGTQTPGKIKGNPLSPVNRLSTDEISLRSESWDGGVNDEISTNTSLLNSNTMSNNFNTSEQDISVEISVTKGTANDKSDKENGASGSSLMNGDTTEIPVRATNIFSGQRLIASELDKNLENMHIFEPGLNMRIRTPIRRHTLDEKLLGTPDCYSYVQLDKPRYELAYNDLSVNEGADSCSVTVAVRVRPFSQRYLVDSVFISCVCSRIIYIYRKKALQLRIVFRISW